MIITESGKRYVRVPYGCDHEVWDKMNIVERLQYLGVLDMGSKTIDPADLNRFNPYMDPLMVILKTVFAALSLPVEFAPTEIQTRAFSEARQVYCLRARIETKASLAQIGEPIGRDHSTVHRNIKNALNVRELIQIYESIYGKAEIEKASLGEAESFTTSNGVKSTNGLLSYCSLDERKQDIPKTEPIVQ